MAFVGLVRVMVRADGRMTDEEMDALSQLAAEVGPRAFWEAMRSAQESLPHPEDVYQAAAQIQRPAVRAWVHSVLLGISVSDGMDDTEATMLDRVLELWGIE
jgi:uncharacterized tellurite resistance protein B-like protein